MQLTTLKSKLQVIAGTLIGEVFFDYQAYVNETRSKTYPCVLWMLDGATFKEDERSSTIQKIEIFTMSVFAIASFNINSQDKITEWDKLRGYFRTYLNLMDATAGIQIMNIDNINGQYAGEGLISADREIGIIYKDVQIKMFC